MLGKSQLFFLKIGLKKPNFLVFFLYKIIKELVFYDGFAYLFSLKCQRENIYSIKKQESR